MKIEIGVPCVTYLVSYHGVVIHIENKMRVALSRLPRNVAGWRITYTLENDPEGTPPRVAFEA